MENRIANVMKDMEEREERFKSLFSSDVISSRVFRLEKLKEYEHLLTGLPKGLSKEEKVYRRLLRQERRQLERQLYPNRWVKLAVNLFKLTGALMNSGFRMVNSMAGPSQNNTLLQEQFRQAGFSKEMPKAEQQIANGIDSFTLPVTRYRSENQRMEYRLNIERDDKGFHLANYSAGLEIDGRPGQSKRMLIQVGDDWQPNEKQVYNLLSGRAVGDDQGNWRKLDFTDKDAAGNLKVREFSVVNFDLRNILEKLPVAGLMVAKEVKRMLNGFTDGDRVPVVMELKSGDKEVALELNPQKRGVEFYDMSGKKISREEALELPVNAQKQSQEHSMQLVPNEKLKDAPKNNLRKL